MRILNAAIAVLCLNGTSCRQPVNNAPVRDTVLSSGQTVEATNKSGKIRISYLGPTKRKYEWDDQERIVTLKARSDPFQGKLGIYEPGEGMTFSMGTGLVLEEAVRRFENEEQIKAALAESANYMDWVYTKDGLVVGFGRTSARRQINVSIWQFLLQGQKPSNLVGATPDRIVLKTSN